MATSKEKETQQKSKQTEEKRSTSNSNQEASKTQSGSDMSQQLDELLQVLNGDLGTIDPENGLELIAQWSSFLTKAQEPEAKELAGSLKELQKMLKSGKATGHELSEELIHLGEQTSEIAGNVESGIKQPVQRLGKQLRQAGTSIAKAEDQEYHQQLDVLVEQSEGESLTSLEPEAAVGAIDLWYNLLNKAEGDQFQAVAASLKELKQTLKRGNAKPETIAKALSKVGEQTTEISSEAPRGFKGAVQKLGKQLTKAGASLGAAD